MHAAPIKRDRGCASTCHRCTRTLPNQQTPATRRALMTAAVHPAGGLTDPVRSTQRSRRAKRSVAPTGVGEPSVPLQRRRHARRKPSPWPRRTGAMVLAAGVVAGLGAIPIPGGSSLPVAKAETPATTTPTPPKSAGTVQVTPTIAAGMVTVQLADGPRTGIQATPGVKPGDPGRAVIGLPGLPALPRGAQFGAGQSLWTVFRSGTVAAADAGSLLIGQPLIPTVLLYDATKGAAVIAWAEGR